MSNRLNLSIKRGSTFSRVLRWSAPPLVYKTISAVPTLAPLTLTVTGHGLVDGWRAAITAVNGMTEINAANAPPKPSDYLQATLVDANTVAFNAINAAGFGAYTSGGVLQYYTPVDLAGYDARLQVRAKAGDTGSPILLELSVSNGGILLDNSAKTITLTAAAAATVAYTFKRGVYDLELQSPAGVVTTLLTGVVEITQEVTQ